jgi:hypothetical protein
MLQEVIIPAISVFKTAKEVRDLIRDEVPDILLTIGDAELKAAAKCFASTRHSSFRRETINRGISHLESASSILKAALERNEKRTFFGSVKFALDGTEKLVAIQLLIILAHAALRDRKLIEETVIGDLSQAYKTYFLNWWLYQSRSDMGMEKRRCIVSKFNNNRDGLVQICKALKIKKAPYYESDLTIFSIEPVNKVFERMKVYEGDIGAGSTGWSIAPG